MRHRWHQDGDVAWTCVQCGALRIRLKRSNPNYPVYQYLVKGRTGRLNVAPVCRPDGQLEFVKGGNLGGKTMETADRNAAGN